MIAGSTGQRQVTMVSISEPGKRFFGMLLMYVEIKNILLCYMGLGCIVSLRCSKSLNKAHHTDWKIVGIYPFIVNTFQTKKKIHQPTYMLMAFHFMNLTSLSLTTTTPPFSSIATKRLMRRYILSTTLSFVITGALIFMIVFPI